jgi:antitoxin (DNA-binding transcriptional repressor) of toxin-antitoxin stability system
MEVNITRFRSELFELVNRALNGELIYVTHKGVRVRLVPEGGHDRLSRITPLQVVNPNADPSDATWKDEMREAWERDWADL